MKYRKKPVVIEAIQYEGDNTYQCLSFCPTAIEIRPPDQEPYLQIPTLEGTMNCNIGDYLIKGIAGEYYPCKPDIFQRTYEAEP